MTGRLNKESPLDRLKRLADGSKDTGSREGAKGAEGSPPSSVKPTDELPEPPVGGTDKNDENGTAARAPEKVEARGRSESSARPATGDHRVQLREYAARLHDNVSARHVYHLAATNDEVYERICTLAASAPDPKVLAIVSDWIYVRLRERGYFPEPKSHQHEMRVLLHKIWGSDPASYPGAAWDEAWAHDIKTKTMRYIANYLGDATDIPRGVNEAMAGMVAAEDRADHAEYLEAARQACREARRASGVSEEDSAGVTTG